MPLINCASSCVKEIKELNKTFNIAAAVLTTGAFSLGYFTAVMKVQKEYLTVKTDEEDVRAFHATVGVIGVAVGSVISMLSARAVACVYDKCKQQCNGNRQNTQEADQQAAEEMLNRAIGTQELRLV